MIIGIILGLLIGGIIVYCVCNPKNKQIIEINKENELKNQKIFEEIASNKRILAENEVRLNNLKSEYEETSNKLLKFIEETDKKMSTYASQQLDSKRKEFDLTVESWKKEFSDIKSEMVNSYIQEENRINLSLGELNEKYEEDLQKIQSLSSLIAAAVEANKRAEEIRLAADFYRLQISQEDIEEIKRLRTVEPFLRDPTPLNKVIYKYYYENAYNGLVGRLFGNNKSITGIYKITNIENGMCYIGQSVDVRERFRQHIKKGVGAETPNKNKLYPALKIMGVENFTFELIEECSQEQLDEKEKFWIDYYKSQEFGYNATRGG